ncbi:MAG TPA: DUF2277 domain-containing protein [Ktedonobacteraceae bacterium]
MCRNIKMLFNIDPPVSEEEIHQAALQFVRKVSGYAKPSQANEAVFLAAVDAIAASTSTLLNSLETHTPARDRADIEQRARTRTAQRFAR